MTARLYATDGDLRAALETRLARHAAADGITVARLRKECAFQRLLARFVTVDDRGRALKGGVSQLWRVDPRLRATADVDANWRSPRGQLDRFLLDVQRCDLADGFDFVIGDGRPMRGEDGGGTGGLRHAVLARMDDREFERFHLDVNFADGDVRPVERLPVRTAPLAFADVIAPRVTVPVISLGQQLAEKLHACVRIYAGAPSSRPKDAFDVVAVARLAALPPAGALLEAVRETFAWRGDPVPATVPELPAGWDPALAALLDDCPLSVAADARDLRARFAALWRPVLDRSAVPRARFDGHSWTWSSP